MDPHIPTPHNFSLKVGNTGGEIPYVCLIHQSMGMKGILAVTPKPTK